MSGLVRAARADLPNRDPGHAELARKRGRVPAPTADPSCPDLVGLRDAEAVRPALAGTRPVASLCLTVGHVVGVRSEPEVRRVATEGDVACVEDVQTVGNFAMREAPRPTVRAVLPAEETHVSVTAVLCRPGPKPTTVARVWRQPLPETLGRKHLAHGR